MPFAPNAARKDELLKAIGAHSIDDLFTDIPHDFRAPIKGVPNGIGEGEVLEEVSNILSSNVNADDAACFLGQGFYNRYLPTALKSIVGRSEFYSAYTPYQAEISQGMLQALFEYQSIVAELTGMDAVNTSMYDGPTALGEAARMAYRLKDGDTFLIPRAISAEKKSILHNYLIGTKGKLVEVPYDSKTGQLTREAIEKAAHGRRVFGLYVESPNAFGVLEEVLPHAKQVLGEAMPLVVGIDPLAQAVLEPPASFGADIVVGEGQGIGIPLQYGGPTTGIFGCRKEHVRKMPGRIIGMTHDRTGRRAFCMTLLTREQHIRRSKAMSNICTNESLLSLAFAAHAALLGAEGLKRLAQNNMANARAMVEALRGLKDVRAPLFSGPYFNEVLVQVPCSAEALVDGCLEDGVLSGIPLTSTFPELGQTIALAATELTSESHVKRLRKSWERRIPMAVPAPVPHAKGGAHA
jgi:glycine dehydrogenase subunit 1